MKLDNALRTLSMTILLTAALVAAGCGGGGDKSPSDGDADTTDTTDLIEADAETGDLDETADTSDPVEEEQIAVDECGRAIVAVPSGCTGCHGAPPTRGGHSASARCYLCHGQVVDENYKAVNAALHMNGSYDTSMTCISCHGNGDDSAPPMNLDGECAADAKGVGAHQAHRGMCSSCHVAPVAIDDAGHMDDDDGVAEVVFAGLAVAGNATPSWNGSSCSAVYCHGATLTGGEHKTPSWNDRSGAAGACGACHRLASPSGDTTADCSSCHSATIEVGGGLKTGGAHLNGVVDYDE